MAPYVPLPGFFGQYTPAQLMKPGDGSQLYPQYITPLPHPIQLPAGPPGTDPNQPGFQPQHFYPFVPFGAPHMYPYMIPRPDGQAPNYMILPVFSKPGAVNTMPNDVQEQDGGNREDGSTPQQVE
jgi:hypothetical protein